MRSSLRHVLLDAGDRVRQSPDRAAQLVRLRRGLVLWPAVLRRDPLLLRLAGALGRAKLALNRELSGVTACSRCAVGLAAPHGLWPGGMCCGTATDEVFTDDELAALALLGTRVEQIVAPTTMEGGCVLRGPRGCVLEPLHRPTICISHLCRELEAELRRRGRLAVAEELAGVLRDGIGRFSRRQSDLYDDHLLAGGDPVE